MGADGSSNLATTLITVLRDLYSIDDRDVHAVLHTSKFNSSSFATGFSWYQKWDSGSTTGVNHSMHAPPHYTHLEFYRSAANNQTCTEMVVIHAVWTYKRMWRNTPATRGVGNCMHTCELRFIIYIYHLIALVLLSRTWDLKTKTRTRTKTWKLVFEDPRGQGLSSRTTTLNFVR